MASWRKPSEQGSTSCAKDRSLRDDFSESISKDMRLLYEA